MCGDGEPSFGNLIVSLGLGLAILVASTRGLILFRSIESLWAGVSSPRHIASSDTTPVGAFYVYVPRILGLCFSVSGSVKYLPTPGDLFPASI